MPHPNALSPGNWPDEYRRVKLEHIAAVRFLAEASKAHHAGQKMKSGGELVQAEERLEETLDRVAAAVAALQMLPRAYRDGN